VLPLVQGGRLLGYFLARGVKLAAPKAEQRLLAALAGQVLERFALAKRAVTDALTGLATREHLLARLTREIALVQECLAPAGDTGRDPDLQGFSGSAGLVLLDLDGFQRINERYGYAVGDAVLAEVGRAIGQAAPRHVTAARLSDDKFALLVPDARPRFGFQLAEAVREAVARVARIDPASGDSIRVTGSLGFAYHPQNLAGPELARAPAEQARILLRKAQKAVGLAKDLGRNRVLAYGDILKSGGRILEVLPLGRLCVGLGRSVGAAEGQRFLVVAPRPARPAEARLTEDERLVGRYPAMYKGEVVLCEVQEDLSFAEVLHLGDPALGCAAGDRLSLVQERDGLFDAETAEDSVTKSGDGMLGYRDFLAFFSTARAKAGRFCLVLLKVLDQPRAGAANYQRAMDARVRKAADLLGERLAPQAVGRFGLAGLAAFVPERDPAEVAAAARSLVEAAARKKQTLAVGVAFHPCLSFGRADALENARKALEHALLLPAPRAALFDSVSLNISADALAQDGDLYAAVEEYKLALLSDETNQLAHNSLGICLAQLNRLDQARRHFEQALALAPDDLLALYNLGWACQRLGDFAAARAAFERCLALDPKHVFSLIRLGTLAEREGDAGLAERRFAEAAALPGGETLAVRHLARLALSRRDFDQARELLHRALSANHNDAHSMHLLATLYLDAGEDPQIAEVLARQASALLPERAEFRAALSRALEAQGRHDEARMALGRRAG
jgi:diguanylate cyclase (GGDEF)-like protein